MKIHNFAIIAHVDHGKSTLADRLLELCRVVKPNQHEDQMLDRNPISRERGITIKLSPVRMDYELEGELHRLNLVDTPGHVDFSYEVERTLACVEGVVLLVDATQGIQAQTIAHAYKALEQNLTIIPVINKIDRPEAQVESVTRNLAEFLGIETKTILKISAKDGSGCEELLKEIVRRIPTPEPRTETSAQGLIFDSYFDPHLGVIAFVRAFSGAFHKGDSLTLIGTETTFEAQEVGYFAPDIKPSDAINSNEIGYVVTSLKSIKHVRVGDTLTSKQAPARQLPGYKRVKPMVYAFIFPTDNADFEALKLAIGKLALNDSSLEYSGIYSQALGPGLRVGFLGLLHAEIVRERLEKEHNLNLVITPAQVEFKLEGGQFFEPIAKVNVITPALYLNAIMEIAYSYRAELTNTNNVNTHNQVIMTLDMPLAELMGNNFFDTLKSISSGYASLDWEFTRFQEVDAAQLEILINLKEIPEFSQIVVKDKSYLIAQKYVHKLQKLIPRQQFEIKIQARYQNKIIASTRVAPYRKDVTAKLYGGDRTRKDKLLNKQKKGKQTLKQIGTVAIPKETFVKLFKE